MKFLIYTIGRTGSTLLLDLLRNCPDVDCEGEILSSIPENPLVVVEARYRLSQKPCFGFKVKSSHLNSPQVFLETLRQDGWKFIYLERDNILDTCISQLYAKEIDTYFFYRSKTLRKKRPLVTLNIDDIMRELETIIRHREFDQNLFSLHDHIKITYEKDLLESKSRQKCFNRLFTFLGLECTRPKLFHLPTEKSIQNYTSVISNWDNLSKQLETSIYASYMRTSLGC